MGEELTALKLNEQIVKMRKSVQRSRVRLCRRLIRLKSKLEKGSVPKMKRKAIRITEEIKASKRIRHDDVSKFALINLKPLSKLNITENTPASERVLYKLAVEPVMLEVVNTFRKNYPDWHCQVPFILQRLGMQYRSKKKHSVTVDSNSCSPKISAAEASVNSGTSSSPAEKSVRDIIRHQIKKAAQKEETQRRKKTKSDGQKESKGPKIAELVGSLPRRHLISPDVTKGEVVIQRLNLDVNTSVKDVKLDDPIPVKVPSRSDRPSSFFMTTETSQGDASSIKLFDDESYDDKRSLPERKSPADGNPKIRGDKRQNHGKIANEESSSSYKQLNRPGTNIVKQESDLHPSWIAKKRQRKEQAKLTDGPHAKKIVFSDD